MEVYLLRHAESEYNVDPVNNDFIDCSITQKGQQQAAALILPHDPYDLILCSPLRRCRQTIDHSSLPQSSSQAKLEICFLLREKVEAKCDLLEDEGIEVLQEETNESVEKRVFELNEYLNMLKSKEFPNYKKVLLVSHADFLWALTSHRVENEKFGKWLNNCELVYWKTF
jgi:broad specificity phosphatase PhoE